MFQSLIGSIKRLKSFTESLTVAVFQSLIGSIKSKIGIRYRLQ